VKEPDGIFILEAPISGLYSLGVFKEARKRHPGVPINAVLSTSDSWPHTGGVRQVKRENLIVDTVFPMHQGPMPWPQVIALIEKSTHS
jgi:hypothetical protein